MSEIERRKKEHLDLSKSPDSQLGLPLFADYMLDYKALPEIDYKDVSTICTLFNKELRQPLFISSMTGGGLESEVINRNISIAASEMGIAFGVGSQRAAIVNKDNEESFRVARIHAPKAFIFANMGAVQLNYGYDISHYQRVVDLIEADALYLHVNPLQEALQPEGDTNFSGLLSKMEELVKKISVPVFIKEVGHGLSPKICKLLAEMGVKGIDIAGVGGTSWAWIEGKRAKNDNLTHWFKDFGLPTEYIIENLEEMKNSPLVVASGGIRNPIQGLKSLIFGADFYATAQPFLRAALESPEEVIAQLKDWEKGLKIAMFACGVTSLAAVKNIELIKKSYENV